MTLSLPNSRIVAKNYLFYVLLIVGNIRTRAILGGIILANATSLVLRHESRHLQSTLAL